MLARFTHPPSRRLSGRAAFTRVYGAKVRVACPPLVVHSAKNDLHHLRLGMSVPRAVGSAVLRNRIKRRLREAFRHIQPGYPRGYDLVIAVRPHIPLAVAEYQSLLKVIFEKLDQRFSA